MAFTATAVRTAHANISAFIAPMVFFYALSGALQIFNLHKSHPGYHAPAILTAVGSLHKDQVFAPVPERKRHPGMGSKGGGFPPGGPPPDEGPTLGTVLLKWLFFLEALGLAATTVFGVWIGVTHAKRKRTIIVLLAAGTIVPLVLIATAR